MQKYVVAIDIDGVVWDLLTPWLKMYNKISGDTLEPNDVKSYNVSEYITGDHTELLEYVLKIEVFWNGMTLYDGVKEAIERLQEDGRFDIVFVTATDYNVALKKFNKLFELLPNIDESQLIITKRKDLVTSHFMVDDWECNLKHMAETGKGVPILVNQPYNKSFPNDIYGIKRCNSLLEATDIIIGYINKQEL